jgi:hypothetical protein
MLNRNVFRFIMSTLFRYEISRLITQSHDMEVLIKLGHEIKAQEEVQMWAVLYTAEYSSVF